MDYDIKRLLDDKLYVELFCARYHVHLTDIGRSDDEDDPYGSMYFFSDHFGGYTLKGIKKSLKEE